MKKGFFTTEARRHGDTEKSRELRKDARVRPFFDKGLYVFILVVSMTITDESINSEIVVDNIIII